MSGRRSLMLSPLRLLVLVLAGLYGLVWVLQNLVTPWLVYLIPWAIALACLALLVGIGWLVRLLVRYRRRRV